MNSELGGVCDLMRMTAHGRWLHKIEVGEVWGIGGASERKPSGVDERTVLGLRGIACLALEHVAPHRKR